MKLKVTPVGMNIVSKQFRDLAKQAKLDTGQAVDFAAAQAQKMVVRNVQPFGMSGKAKVAGEKTLVRDIYRCIEPVSDHRAGDPGVINSLIEADIWHKSRRRKRTGSVPEGGERRPMPYSLLQKYITEKLKRVGSAKRSVVDGAPALGNKFQKWLRTPSRSVTRSRWGLFSKIWQFNLNEPHVSSPNVFGQRGIYRVYGRIHGVLKSAIKGKIKRMKLK